jgi:MFS family permease
MNITLKKDSWHFKIYSKVLSDKAPKSLCPYFWQWVAMIICSPILFLFWVMGVLTKFFEPKPKPKKSIHDMTEDELIEENERLNKKLKRSDRAANILIGVFGLFFLGLIVLFMYFGVKKDGWFNFFRNTFAMVGLAVSVYWTIVMLSKTSKKIGDSNVVKVPLAMIKAIYTKTCPIINWR